MHLSINGLTFVTACGKMLLRTLWSRLGAQRPLERKPVCIFASSCLSQSTQPHQYEYKPRTHSDWCAARTSPRTCYLNTLHQQQQQQQQHIRHALPAFGGFKSLSSSLFIDSGMLTQSGQKRLYSSDIIKPVLKTLKPVAVPAGKRVPKGPRTKQPSRANQPTVDEDKVMQQVIGWVIDTLKYSYVRVWSQLLMKVCLFSVGYDAVYRLCNSRSVSLANTLPWLD